jgi:CspA family cold shock protein
MHFLQSVVNSGRPRKVFSDVAEIFLKLPTGGYQMPQGTIKKILDKGFGFINGDDGDIFFHRSAVENVSFEELREGQMVDYNVGEGPKGPCAENVRPV